MLGSRQQVYKAHVCLCLQVDLLCRCYTLRKGGDKGEKHVHMHGVESSNTTDPTLIPTTMATPAIHDLPQRVPAQGPT